MPTRRKTLLVNTVVAMLVAPAAARPLPAQTDTTSWDVTRPRGRARTISFTTDEGTWTSLDVSPNGRVIVFDMAGELWTLPMEGGEARPITKASGIALNYHPTFSPDGARIAFISDRDGQDNVWVMNVDGSNPRQVSNQRENRMALPVWTPDGNYLIAQIGGDANIRGRAELWMYHVDGGRGVRLTSDSISASWPEVSPDGRYVYYEERVIEGFGDPDPARGLYQLRRLDRQTGKILPITSGTSPVRDGGGGRRSSGSAIAPAVSPDGRWLAFGRRIADGNQTIAGHEYGPRTALWLRDLQTGAERIVMDPITPDIQERNNAGALPRYSWMPDSRSIVIPEGGKLRRLDITSGRITTIPFSARVEETISEQVLAPIRVSDGPLDVRMIRWHSASPDGRVLAFVALDKIWLMDLPGGKPRRLTAAAFTAQEYTPAWSPDGRWVAFTTWSDAEGGQVWKLLAAGGTPQRLTQVPGTYINPAWTADGGRIVVARGSGEMLRGRMPSDEAWFELQWLPASGGEAHLITEVNTSGRSKLPAPKLGPQGRVFYLESGPPSFYEFRSVQLDGNDPQTHMLLEHSDEAAPSPDGRWLAFSRGDNVYLSPLPWPGVTGEPVRLTVDQPPLPVKRLSLEGGNFPDWIGGTTLEWGSATRYFRYHTTTQATDTVAITLQVPRARASGTAVLVGARVITMEGDRVILRGDVVVRDGRIAAVGESGAVAIPAGAQRFDVAGKTIVPGYIDTHKHTSREARDILSQRSWELAANLAYGITTALEPSGTPEVIFTMADNVEAGVQVGPRIYSTGPSLSSGTTTRKGAVESFADARHEVNRLKSYGARSIKQYWQRRRDQRQKMVEATREAGLMATCEGDTDHISILGIAMDGHTGCEHPILNIPLYRDVTQFLGQADFYYSATLVVGGAGPWGEDFFYQEVDLWKDTKLQRFIPWRWLNQHTRRRALRPTTDYTFPLHAQGAADIIAAGGYATIGAHGQLQGIDSHFEIWMMASAMTPLQALRTATVFPAAMIGVEQDLGTITAGKLADLVVLNRNPLENIRATTDIQYVMKAGILYQGDTLDQLWPERKPFGKFFWHTEGIRGPEPGKR